MAVESPGHLISVLQRSRQWPDHTSDSPTVATSFPSPPNPSFPQSTVFQRRRSMTVNFPPAVPPPSQPIPPLPHPSSAFTTDAEATLTIGIPNDSQLTASHRSSTSASQNSYGRPVAPANLAAAAAFPHSQHSVSASAPVSNSNSPQPSPSTVAYASSQASSGPPSRPNHLNTRANTQDIVPDRLLLSPHHPHSSSESSSRRTLTRALELAREAVQIDATNDDPHAAVIAYSRSVALLSEVMERVRRGEDTSDRRKRNDRRRSVVAQEEEIRRLKSIHDTYADRMNILSLIYSIPVPHSPSVHAPSSTESSQPPSPHDHPSEPAHLNNLGNSFFTQFQRHGELSDLEQAISRYRDAVNLTPHGHPNNSARLSNLGSSLRARFGRLAELSDLEEAISKHKDAVDLTPQSHPNKPAHLGNLGNSFFTRFECLGELSDLEQAITRYRDAVDLTPDGHPDKPAHLDNLSSSVRARFRCLGELKDLEEAISRHRDAIDCNPDGHPDKPTHLTNLGSTLVTRFVSLGELSSLEQAISLYSHAASTSTGPVTVRFRASQKWISCARVIRHNTLLDAYLVAISLLPQLGWIDLSLTHRYYELTRGADVVREAAAAALDSGLPETAVEWLEQGRSIVFGGLLQLRSSYDKLSSAHPHHASRLHELFAALEQAYATREKSLSSFSEQTQSAVLHHTEESLQQEADRHRTLAIERDKLLQEIRRLPGFERFLLHKEFSQLRASAHSGPVVILNAAESRCDGLIVLADVDHVTHVPLPNFTFEHCMGFQRMLMHLHGHADHIRCEEGAERIVTQGHVDWEVLLSTLWNDVVKPVLDALDFSVSGELPRIFWCPTGPFVFLPLHAAGLYGARYSQPGHKVSDFVVSSYIPTLNILSSSPTSDAASSRDLRLLTVCQPHSDGLFPLLGVDTELTHIREAIKNSPSSRITLLESSVGTVEEVLALMQEADWVHFACHGIQDAASPTDSGFCLADQRRLKLSDIIALSHPRGGLAFLSACQTAVGDESLSDEAIHIAAGMLFAGYKGVIGTMWSISDRLTPGVARDVYSQLFRNGGRPDYREAARALHEAIGHLRESGASFDQWLPFIHVGL